MLKNIRFFFLLLTTLLFPFNVLSCSSNNVVGKENKVKNIHHSWLDKKEEYFKLVNSSGLKKNRILSDSFYNQLYSSKEFDKKNSVQFVIIASKNIYTEIVAIEDESKKPKIWDLALKLQSIQLVGTQIDNFLGVWLSMFKLRKENGEFGELQKGEGESVNYTNILGSGNDYYPLLWINHKFSQFGISNWTSSPGEIYEISYDVQI